MAIEQKVELLPCPFCGGEASITMYGNDLSCKSVGCPQCDLCFLENEREGMTAEQLWNRREAARPQVDELIKQAVEEEREECARIAASFNDSSGYRIPERIAGAIKERGLNENA